MPTAQRFVRSKSKEKEFKHPITSNGTIVGMTAEKKLATFFSLSLGRWETITRLRKKGKDDITIVIDLLMAMQPGRAKPPASTNR